tara:strand:- start:1846 stop:3123 length:1278 start_codon:yes stop_codon:yes gene_type:complete
MKISNIHARQILDSRGNPTIEVDVHINDSIWGRAAVPSGASTGKFEAVELRDNNNTYMGKSVSKAVENINSIIAKAIVGMNVYDIKSIDTAMIELDGTKNKKNLGANSILGVSMATIRAAAAAKKQYLFEYLHVGENYILPTPMMNILNGGSHADNNVDIQEFMIFPIGANSFSSALQMGMEIFHTLKSILKKRGLNTNVGDEGGFAPDLQSNEDAIELLMESIIKSGYKLDTEVAIALDVASSELFNTKTQLYELNSEKKFLSSEEMIEYYVKLCNQYSIISIEDGLDENDWNGWKKLNATLGDKIQIVGDDLTVTNPIRLQKAIKEESMNAILIKLNQIGTVSETIEAINMAHSSRMATIISHRSGETEDTIIADFSIATNACQIKTGSLCRSERVAKYNQLLRIEEYLKNNCKYAGNNFLNH